MDEWGYHAPKEGKENLPKIEYYLGNSDYTDKKKKAIEQQLIEMGCKSSLKIGGSKV